MFSFLGWTGVTTISTGVRAVKIRNLHSLAFYKYVSLEITLLTQNFKIFPPRLVSYKTIYNIRQLRVIKFVAINMLRCFRRGVTWNILAVQSVYFFLTFLPRAFNASTFTQLRRSTCSEERSQPNRNRNETKQKRNETK